MKSAALIALASAMGMASAFITPVSPSFGVARRSGNYLNYLLQNFTDLNLKFHIFIVLLSHEIEGYHLLNYLQLLEYFFG